MIRMTVFYGRFCNTNWVSYLELQRRNCLLRPLPWGEGAAAAAVDAAAAVVDAAAAAVDAAAAAVEAAAAAVDAAAAAVDAAADWA